MHGAPWWAEPSHSETELSQDSDGFPTFNFVKSMGVFDPEKKGKKEPDMMKFSECDDEYDDECDNEFDDECGDEAEKLAHSFEKP